MVRRDVVSPATPHTLTASSLERTLAEVNQIQRAMGVGAANRQVERVYIRLETPTYQFRD